MEKNWLLLPIVAAVLLVAVFAAAFFLNQEPISNVDADYTDVGNDEYLDFEYISEDEVGIGDKLDSDSPENYFVPKNIGECTGMGDVNRDNCLALYSIFYDDETACGQINDVTLRNDCFAQVASSKDDPSICENIANGKSECYSSVGIEKNDVASCEKAGSERQQCFTAAASGNMANCPEGYYRNICNDAALASDPSICENIPDEGEFCFLQVALNTNSASLCNKSGDNTNHCFFQVALALSNHKICDSISQVDIRDNCVAWVALNTNNKDICYEAGSQIQSCLQDLSP